MRALVSNSGDQEEEQSKQFVAPKANNGLAVETYEAVSPQGHVVKVQVDMTDLVRRSLLLEARCKHFSHLSITDELTGLVNRRHFDKVLQSEWARALRSRTTIGYLMIDIDFFKAFNDHYGHTAGDACLHRVAQALSRSVRRAGELVARYGGEEFVVLLPRTDVSHLLDTAQRCLDEVRNESIAHVNSPAEGIVSVSIGAAHAVPTNMEGMMQLVKAADRAMYRAKLTGRARIVLASSADWEGNNLDQGG